jgi:acyl-CoA thioester hydrolase
MKESVQTPHDLLFRGVVHPWMCDAMGHLNVRHYTGLFDDCCWHVLTFLLPSVDGGIGWVAATMSIEFVREVAPRTMLVLNPSIVRIGSKSVSTRIEMRDAATGAHYATASFVSVLFDLEARTSLALPEDIRARASRLQAPASA